jgi:Tfp pilus assembly protein PilV
MEVLIAMGILAVGILGFANLQGSLARSDLDARIRTLASNIAEEHLETQKRFTRLAADTEGDAFSYQDIASGSRTVTRGGIEFTVAQTVTDFYWDEASGQFTQSVPPGIVNSDFKLLEVDVTWASSEFVKGEGTSVGSLGSGSVPVSTVISSRVTGINHLALLDELAVQSLCIPMVDCPMATD